MSPTRSSHCIYQLIRDNPSGRKNLPNRLFSFRRDLQRCLKMSLDNKLFHPDSRSLFFEFPQNIHQSVIDTHRQISQQPWPQPYPLQFRIFLSFRSFEICLLLAYRHPIHRIQNILKRLILTHQRIAPCNQNIPQLCILFKISHQPAQLTIPWLLRA